MSSGGTLFGHTAKQGIAFIAYGPLGADPSKQGAPLAATGNSNTPATPLTDVNGKRVMLAEFKGRHVVLEWTNPGCPFMVKHYGSQNMQALQKEFNAKNVVWLSISSTARGHYDYREPAALGSQYKEWGSAQTALLMDDSGKVGQVCGARTTPHMFAIDPAGQLVFAGGIDDKRSANPADVKTARNHVRAALTESIAGKPVSVATATPYGCSVKCASGA